MSKKPPTIWVLEECRGEGWYPCAPGPDESEVIAGIKKNPPGSESLGSIRKEMSEELGIPIRIAKYQRVDP